MGEITQPGFGGGAGMATGEAKKTPAQLAVMEIFTRFHPTGTETDFFAWVEIITRHYAARVDP